ncbi:MAG: hypothetical protein NT084_12265 [Bacteroidetes bacterium]|nr:hypothetical protein [Bacteroidota bacterium]
MKILFSSFFLFIGITSFAQKKSVPDTLSPLKVVELYVSPNPFPEKFKYFCCELYKEWYADSTLGQHLPAKVQRTTQLIFQDTGHATVAVWLHDSLTSLDIYFYLVKKQVWTIYAVRSLVMKQAAEEELKRLDSIPENERGKKYLQAHGDTYTFDYTNLQLWDNSDTVLVSHFIKNKKQFIAIQKRLAKKGFLENDSLVVHALKDKKIKKLSNQVLIRDFEFDKRYPGCVFYVIGGMLDNTVGYLYQPDPKKLPLITEKHYILIKPIGNGWYLFKTT